MKLALKVFLISLFMAGFSFAKYVAILETVTNTKDLISPSERKYLTTVLFEEALKVLPAEQGYTIMTSENIKEMLPPGKALEDCEGTCLAETGKNIQADYVAQARVGKVGENLYISAEVYETGGSKLIASFNGRGATVDALVTVITDKAFGFFKKVRGGASGIMRTDFDGAANQTFVVQVSTNPSGAALSIDGRPVPNCTSTPCQVLVEAGEHRFLAILDQHEDAEAVVSVSGNGQQISLDLAPRYGTLALDLEFPAGGDLSEMELTVDNKSVTAAPTIKLDPGVHAVLLKHRCYNPVSFKVGIFKSKEETFKETLRPLTGGLSLKARSAEGEEIVLPVYANDKQVGETPYIGSVPVCARLAIGEAPSVRPLELNIVQGDVLNYEYVEPPQKGGSTAKRRRANTGVNNASTTPERGTSIPTNVSTSSSSSSYTSLSDVGEWILTISAVVLGVGFALGIYGELDAETQYEYANADNYEEKMDEAKTAQTIRDVGWGMTAVGGIGFVLGLTFVIVDF